MKCDKCGIELVSGKEECSACRPQSSPSIADPKPLGDRIAEYIFGTVVLIVLVFYVGGKTWRLLQNTFGPALPVQQPTAVRLHSP
jgi:hypothetical protein